MIRIEICLLLTRRSRRRAKHSRLEALQSPAGGFYVWLPGSPLRASARQSCG
jgi:hypothetical protein